MGWEVGLAPVLFGVRVRMGKVGDCGPALDYCGGSDAAIYGELLRRVVAILLTVPESATYADIRNAFHVASVKPANSDPVFWDELLQLYSAALLNAGIEAPPS